MPRPTFAHVLLCLLAGALLTIALAWTCALAVDASGGTQVTAERSVPGLSWDVRRHDAFGSTLLSSLRIRYPRVDAFVETVVVSRPAPEAIARFGALERPMDAFESGRADHERRLIEARGWPLRALWCEHELGAGGVVAGVRGGIATRLRPWGGPTPMQRVLPLRPVWPGFALDTILLGAATWAAVVAPIALIRRRRRERGRCAKCGHRLAGLATCPECGMRNAEC